jgi:Domain of unknown function (DUF6285)
MRDLPTGTALLALARDVLLNDLLPLLPPESRLDARLVASSMAVAEREAVDGVEASQEILRGLKELYRDAIGDGEPDALRRLGSDLRAGAFESSARCERRARDTLWRLTIAKLRQANPRFLAANGFG